MKGILEHKKAQSLPTSTIILMILGLVVLVLLILYFTGGLKSLMDILKGKTGVYSGTRAEAVSYCETLCDAENVQFCKQSFVFSEGGEEEFCKDLITCSTMQCS